MKAVKAFSRGLAAVEGGLTALVLGVMVVLSFLQVILRNFFSTGILWVDPFLRHLVLWAGFLGASLATRQEKHISLEVITRFLRPRGVESARLAANLFACAVTVFLALAGLTFVRSEMASPEELFRIGEVSFAAWWFETIIPAGFALMAFRFLIRAIEHMGGVVHPPEAVEPAEDIPTFEK
jgi:TRAP-type C4-dicarboxylate transport system permease small subunit